MTGRALVVGGGVAGSAIALALARAGREIVLCEREAVAHDKVCGEFLSREAALYLAALGVDPEGLGAVPIDRVRLATGDLVAERHLPFRAFSLTRRALDEAMLLAAAAAGAEIRRGQRVQAAERADEWAAGRNGELWRARLQDGTVLAGGALFLATGKHDLRGWGRPPGVQSDLTGFKLYWRLSPDQAAALAGAVELHLFPGGYAGLQPVEDGRANLCLVVRRSRFAALGQDWAALLSHMRAHSGLLDRRLAGAAPCADRPMAIAGIPYGMLCRRSDGPWRLGDQAAVIPSFSGDGISIALHGAHLAARHYLAGRDSRSFQRRLARDVAAPVGLATLLSLFAVRDAGRITIGRLARAAPLFMGTIAGATRVPMGALRRAGLQLA